MVKLKTRTNQPVEGTEELLNNFSNFLNLEDYISTDEAFNDGTLYHDNTVYRTKNDLKYNEFMKIMQKNAKYYFKGHYFHIISFFDPTSNVTLQQDFVNYNGLPFLELISFISYSDTTSGLLTMDGRASIRFLKDNENNVYFSFIEI